MKVKTKIILLSMYPFIVYLAIFNMMQWSDYKWEWSESNAVLALQYMTNGAWFISVIGLSVSCVLYVIFVLTNGFKP